MTRRCNFVIFLFWILIILWNGFSAEHGTRYRDIRKNVTKYSRNNYLNFSIKGSNKALFGLFTESLNHLSFEIEIGTVYHPASKICEIINGQCIKRVNARVGFIIQNKYSMFWLSWGNQKIQFGIGEIIGNNVSMAWDTHKPNDVIRVSAIMVNARQRDWFFKTEEKNSTNVDKINSIGLVTQTPNNATGYQERESQNNRTGCNHHRLKVITDEQFKKLLKELKIDVKNTSNYKRSKSSAPDYRMSSRAIGGVGIAVFVTFTAATVIPDIINFAKSILRRIQNLT